MSSAAAPLVIDVGAHSVRAGAAGEALPRVIARSVVGAAAQAVLFKAQGHKADGGGRHATCKGGDGAGGEPAPLMPPQGADPSLLGGFLNPLEKTDHVEVLPAIRYKVTRLDEPGTYVANAAALERLIEEVCGARCLDAATSDRALLLTEPNITHLALRDLYAELAFEGLQVPELLLSKKAALAAFACARTSAVVCDVGHTNSSVCAVHEGFVLQRAIQEVPFGFHNLLTFSERLLEQRGIPLTPGFAVASGTDAGSGAPVSEGGNNAASGSCHSTSVAGGEGSAVPHSQRKGSSATAAQTGTAATGASAAAKSSSLNSNNNPTSTTVLLSCPHVTASFSEFGRHHVLEVLLQLLAKCKTRAAAAKAADPQCAAAEAAAAVTASLALGDSPFRLPDGTQLPPPVAAELEAAVPELLLSSRLKWRHRSLLLRDPPAAAAGRVEGSAVFLSGASVSVSSNSGSAAASSSSAQASPSASAVVATYEQQLQAQPDLLACIEKCVKICASPARRDVIAAFVPTGGGSLAPGFLRRMREELEHIASAPDLALPPGALRVVASRGAPERHLATWIGGSIVGCLGTFSQLAVTRQEYMELGPRNAISKKCP